MSRAAGGVPAVKHGVRAAAFQRLVQQKVFPELVEVLLLAVEGVKALEGHLGEGAAVKTDVNARHGARGPPVGSGVRESGGSGGTRQVKQKHGIVPHDDVTVQLP